MQETVTTAELEVREAGPGRVPTPPVGELPAGGATWIPHQLTKISVVNQSSRSYQWSFDQALAHSRSNTEAMENDLVIWDALYARKKPVCQLSWTISAVDESDPQQVEAAKKLTKVVQKTPRFSDFLDTLMWALWPGRAGVYCLYEWQIDPVTGDKLMVVRDHRGIHGDSLVARWGNDWGLLVNGLYEGKTEGIDAGGAVHWLEPREREAVVIHCHDPRDVSFFKSQFAGQIRGTGLRNAIYWTWHLKSNMLALASDYVERFANGIWTGFFDESNPDGKAEMEAAIAGYRASRVLMFPRNKATQLSGYGVEIKEVGTGTPSFLMELINYFDEQIRRFITGQSLTDGMEVRVGGDGVGVMEDRVGAVTKYDASRLAETLNREWLPVLTKYNCGPGVPPPVFKFDIDSPDAADILGYAKVLHDLGGEIDLDHLFSVCGLPRPSPGDSVASKLAPMQSVAAATQTPQGVPMSGSPGPVDQSQQPVPTSSISPVAPTSSVGTSPDGVQQQQLSQ